MTHKFTKKEKVLGAISAFVVIATALGLLLDVSEKFDPWIHTEAEAAEEHNAIILAEEQVQQTQAGFNAFTLRLLLEQEIELLELQIEVEDDEEEKSSLKYQLKKKQDFIQQLEDEERRQMLKGAKT